MSMNLSGPRLYTAAASDRAGAGATATTTLDDLYGCTELFVYQTPNKKVTGFESLKLVYRGRGLRDYLHRRRPAGT